MSNLEAEPLVNRNYLVPNVAVHGSENTAPAAGTVLASTGALSAGTYLVRVSFATTDTANNLIQLAHRNSANNADIELADGSSGVAAGNWSGGWLEAIFTLAANELVVVRNKNAGTAALFYQANVYAWLIS